MDKSSTLLIHVSSQGFWRKFVAQMEVCRVRRAVRLSYIGELLNSIQHFPQNTKKCE